ncbi:MAG: DUF1616 domain-containing protein [Candidatus Bathyarchaeota archaeon]|nr:MAG: DUF1616 domain-containing protein [Candidatus Bathyarchaeota archaeon]
MKVRGLILQLLEEERPKTIRQLVKLVREKVPLQEEKILDIILDLQKEGKVRLKENVIAARSLFSYLRTNRAYWYWITIILAATTAIFVFTVPEDAYPLVYVRYILGSFFVLWMPGYTFVKALYPTDVPIRTSSPEFDTVERVALSIGMSLALVPLMGLLLNYAPWGIQPTSVTASLLTFALIFATAAVIREFQIKTSLS